MLVPPRHCRFPCKTFWGAVAFVACILVPAGGGRAQQGYKSELDSLRMYAVNVFRTPRQPWPGYGIYLGQGLVITAAHVVGRVGSANPTVSIAGQEIEAEPVKQGDFGGVDLTLLRIATLRLPVRMGLRVLPLCDAPPVPGEPVVVVIPESVAPSSILSPEMLPADVRSRFNTVIADVASTGNSGSGVFDAAKQCLLGIMSRKIQRRYVTVTNGVRVEKLIDIAKYFVPAAQIRQFITANHQGGG